MARRSGRADRLYLLRKEVEVGIQQLPELMMVPGIDIIGPLPPDIQSMTVFSAGALDRGQESGRRQGADPISYHARSQGGLQVEGPGCELATREDAMRRLAIVIAVTPGLFAARTRTGRRDRGLDLHRHEGAVRADRRTVRKTSGHKVVSQRSGRPDR